MSRHCTPLWIMVFCYGIFCTYGNLLEQGIAAEKAGLFDDAGKMFAAAAEKRPHDARAFYHLGRFALRRSLGIGDSEVSWGSWAIQSLREAIRLAPSHDGVRRSLGTALLFRADVGSVEFATMLEFMGLKVSEASEPVPLSTKPVMIAIVALALLRALSPAITGLFPAAPVGDHCTGNATSEVPQTRDESWSAPQVLVLLREAMDRDTSLFELPLALGYIAVWHGNCAEAASLAREAIRRAPQHRGALHHAGNLLKSAGLEHEAWKLFDNAVSAGLWKHPLQRVLHPHPDIPARLTCRAGTEADLMLDSFLLSVQAKLDVFERELRDVLFDGKGVYKVQRARTLETFRCAPGHVCRRIRPLWPPFPLWTVPETTNQGGWSETYIWSQEPGKHSVKGGCDMDRWPETCNILTDLVNLNSGVDIFKKHRLSVRRVAVSVVEPPFTFIPEHASRDREGHWRVHCPVLVPPESSSFLKVGSEQIEFVQGRCFCFDESFLHTSLYEDGGSGQPRASLYFDVVHPARIGESRSEEPDVADPFERTWFAKALRPGGPADEDDGLLPEISDD